MQQAGHAQAHCCAHRGRGEGEVSHGNNSSPLQDLTQGPSTKMNVTFVSRHAVRKGKCWVLRQSGLEMNRVGNALERAMHPGRPLCVLSNTFALTACCMSHYCDLSPKKEESGERKRHTPSNSYSRAGCLLPRVFWNFSFMSLQRPLRLFKV